MNMSVLKKIRIWYLLRNIQALWAEVLLPYQISIVCAVLCALLFYTFGQSPWYMSIVVFWAAGCLVLSAAVLAGAVLSDKGMKHAK